MHHSICSCDQHIHDTLGRHIERWAERQNIKQGQTVMEVVGKHVVRHMLSLGKKNTYTQEETGRDMMRQ